MGIATATTQTMGGQGQHQAIGIYWPNYLDKGEHCNNNPAGRTGWGPSTKDPPWENPGVESEVADTYSTFSK